MTAVILVALAVASAFVLAIAWIEPKVLQGLDPEEHPGVGVPGDPETDGTAGRMHELPACGSMRHGGAEGASVDSSRQGTGRGDKRAA